MVSAAVALAGGDAFDISGAPIARDGAAVEAGLDFRFSRRGALGFTYGGQFSHGSADQSIKGELTLKF